MSEAFEEQGSGQPVDDRPDYLLERFGTVEDQAKSYAELERSYTRGQQELSGLRQAYEDLAERMGELEDLGSQEPPPQYAGPDPYDQQPMFLNMIQQARDSEDLVQEFAVQAAYQRALWEQWNAEQQQQLQQQYSQNWEQVQAQQNEHFAHTTEQLVRQEIPDWDEIKADVAGIIDANEELLNDTSSPTEAVRMLKNATAIYRQQMSDLAGQPGTEATRQAKLQAQTMQGQGTHPGTEQSAEQYWDSVKSQQVQRFRL